MNYNSLFRFLKGFKEQALAVSTDSEHKFELAVQLGNLEIAHELAKEACSVQKWRQLGELATLKGNLDLTEECLREAQDFGGLLLLASSSGKFLECLKFLSFIIFIIVLGDSLYV